MIETRTTDRADVHRFLQAGVRQARSLGRPVLVSWTESVPKLSPLSLWTQGLNHFSDRFYWELPDEGFALAGVGAADTLTLHGGGRFAAAVAEWRALLEGALIHKDAEDTPGAGPILVGGFSFDPAADPPATANPRMWHGFPAGRLILSRYMLATAGDGCRLTVNRVIHPADDPDAESERIASDLRRLAPVEAGGLHDRWRSGDPRTRRVQRPVVDDIHSPESWKALVAAAAETIRRGDAEKIVLARAIRAAMASAPCSSSILRRLAESYPGCTIFALNQGERTFLGATPERLVRLHQGLVQVSCLAGTAARGKTEQEDARLGEQLLSSAKDRAEHAVVLRTLREQLADSCADLRAATEPALLKLRNVQHLYTPVDGRLVSDECILNLVERLHPSPAVGGFPPEAALSFIREREDLDRGWYAGPIGWIDRHGEGDFAVAIRSALLHGNEASLFAGCGIMADSDPEQEFEESCLKLESMLSVLDGADR